MKWWPLVWRSTHEIEVRLNQQIRRNQDSHIALLVSEFSRERVHYQERIRALEQLLERITLTKAGLLKRDGKPFTEAEQKESIPPEITRIINGFKNPDIRAAQLLDVVEARRKGMSWSDVRDALMMQFGRGGPAEPGEAIGAYLEELERLEAEAAEWAAADAEAKAALPDPEELAELLEAEYTLEDPPA